MNRSTFLNTNVNLIGSVGLSGLGAFKYPSYYPPNPKEWSELTQSEKDNFSANPYDSTDKWIQYTNKTRKKRQFFEYVTGMKRKASAYEIELLRKAWNSKYRQPTIKKANTVQIFSADQFRNWIEKHPTKATALKHRKSEGKADFIIHIFDEDKRQRLLAKKRNFSQQDILDISKFMGGINISYNNANIGLGGSYLKRWLHKHNDLISRIKKVGKSSFAVTPKPKPKPKPKPEPKQKNDGSNSKHVKQTVTGGSDTSSGGSSSPIGNKLDDVRQTANRKMDTLETKMKDKKWAIGGVAVAVIGFGAIIFNNTNAGNQDV